MTFQVCGQLPKPSFGTNPADTSGVPQPSSGETVTVNSAQYRTSTVSFEDTKSENNSGLNSNEFLNNSNLRQSNVWDVMKSFVGGFNTNADVNSNRYIPEETNGQVYNYFA